MSQITKINGIPIANTSISAFTYNDANTLTIYENNGDSYSVSINTMTGLTVNGSVSATTFYGDGSNLTGIVVSGITDVYVTGFTYNDANKLTISQNGGKPDLDIFVNTVTGLTFNGDATFNNGNIINPDYLQFNITYTGNTTVEGRMYWDEPNGTVSLGLHDNQVLLQIGQETHYYIKNQSGTTIQDGRVVRAAGTLGSSGRILGEYMIADGSIEGKYTLGVATQDILDGSDGYVTEFGLVRGIDTTGSLYGETWNDGDILYVSPTILGGLTNVRPQAPYLNIEMAIVVYANANGSIFVRPHRYPRISDLQNVTATGATVGDLLVLSNSDVWVNTKTLNSSYVITATSVTSTFYGDGSNLTGIPDYYVTGGTYSNGTLTLNRQNGSVVVTGFSTGGTGTDTYVTGFTNNNGLLTISQNNGISPLTADTTQSRTISFNSNDMALNTASRVTLSPLVMSVTRFAGLGAVDDAGLSFIVPRDYLSDPEFYFTWRAASSSVNNAKIFLDMYTGDTTDTGSLTSIIETMSITDTPTSANVFLYSPTVVPTTPLKGTDSIHLRIYRDPGDAGDTYTGDLDMINFVFRYKSKG